MVLPNMYLINLYKCMALLQTSLVCVLYICYHEYSYFTNLHTIQDWEEGSEATLSEWGSNLSLSVPQDDSLVPADRVSIELPLIR